MPVAASSQQEPPVSARLRHIVPKPPNHHYMGHHGPVSPDMVTNSPNCYGAEDSYDSQGYVPSEHIAQFHEIHDYGPAGLPTRNSPLETSPQYFNTHSPPILNLSPNLSPSNTEQQRTSPVYDLRETTRRRSLQGKVQLVTARAKCTCL